MIKKEEVPVIKDIHYCDRCLAKIGEYGKDNVKMEYWMFGPCTPTEIEFTVCMICIKWIAKQLNYSGMGAECLNDAK